MVLLGPPLVFVLLFFLVPLAQVIWGSFFTPSFTLAHYLRIWNTPIYLQVFGRTLYVAFCTAGLCVLLGYAAALFLAQCGARTRQYLLLCVVIPFFLSMLIRNYIWMALLQRAGLINNLLLDLGVIEQPLALMYNEFGMLVTMTNMLLPYTIFPILSALLAIPPELHDASASLGAGRLRGFLRVTLPLSMPGVAAGGLLVFIVALGFFITPALVGGPKQMMISNLIDFNVREVLNWPFAFALANMLLWVTLAIYYFYVRFVERRGARPGLP
ncbi:ABC transporter permease [Ferrovibrio xuzhouensis]|uniref:ABC transporter permease n=1 Tax=Ferrovibrio xuzhouensis TaxID=1576914 RepID=A0ABV7VM26_9PROT